MKKTEENPKAAQPPIQVFMYLRVATDRQDVPEELEVQRIAVERLAAKYGLATTIADEYVDRERTER